MPPTASVTARRRVYVRGADGNLGSRVLTRLAALEAVDVHAGDRGDRAEGAWDVVVELGVGDHDTRARRRESVTAGAAELLADAETTGARHVVMVSSAMVYGARTNNPVPLTEQAVLRPDPEFVYARQLASAEELLEEWRVAASGRRSAVLRPAVTMAADGTSSLARALAAGLGHRFGEADPPAQFLHLDDLATAVALAVDRELDGVYNVAPDGWIPGERVRALTGEAWRLPLPERVAGPWLRCAGGSSADRSHRACGRTRWCRGWSRTIGCGPRAGSRRSPTSRSTWRAPRPAGGR